MKLRNYEFYFQEFDFIYRKHLYYIVDFSISIYTVVRNYKESLDIFSKNTLFYLDILYKDGALKPIPERIVNSLSSILPILVLSRRHSPNTWHDVTSDFNSGLFVIFGPISRREARDLTKDILCNCIVECFGHISDRFMKSRSSRIFSFSLYSKASILLLAMYPTFHEFLYFCCCVIF